MFFKLILPLLFIGLLLYVLIGVPAGVQTTGTMTASDMVADFFLGTWHGCIKPVSFVVSFFKDAGIYDTAKAGSRAYNAGYTFMPLILFMVVVGIGGAMASEKKPKT